MIVVLDIEHAANIIGCDVRLPRPCHFGPVARNPSIRAQAPLSGLGEPPLQALRLRSAHSLRPRHAHPYHRDWPRPARRGIAPSDCDLIPVLKGCGSWSPHVVDLRVEIERAVNAAAVAVLLTLWVARGAVQAVGRLGVSLHHQLLGAVEEKGAGKWHVTGVPVFLSVLEVDVVHVHRRVGDDSANGVDRRVDVLQNKKRAGSGLLGELRGVAAREGKPRVVALRGKGADALHVPRAPVGKWHRTEGVEECPRYLVQPLECQRDISLVSSIVAVVEHHFQ
mmetsp:Transcript_60807/g.120374  ORF Transcript_60807/g.120374 Transcript_60807/m.120374 type:complete len:280 (-) Transcript_60807:200-1039(-)